MQCKSNIIANRSLYKYMIIKYYKSNIVSRLFCDAFISDPQSCVDFHTAPREEVVLEDETDRVRNLIRLAQTPERNRSGHASQRIGLHALDHGGAHEAGGDRADADPVSRELLRPHHRHGHDAGLRGAVVGLPGVAGAADARDVDDHAAPLERDHALRRFAGAEEDSRQVDVDDFLPLAERHLAHNLTVLDLDQHRIAHDAGVVDEPVEAAEVANHLIERADDAVLVGGIGEIAARECAALP